MGPVKEQIAQSLFDHIPVGVGSKGVIPTTAADLDEVCCTRNIILQTTPHSSCSLTYIDNFPLSKQCLQICRSQMALYPF